MDANIQSVILGVVANGLTSLISSLGYKAKNILLNEELRKKMLAEKNSLSHILQEGITATSEVVEQVKPFRLEEICLFILSPEVEQIVRQIFSAKIAEINMKENLTQIQKEFNLTFSCFFGYEISEIEEQANILFNQILEKCIYSLDLAIDEGILSAHEAKSNLRYRIIMDELATISLNLNLISNPRYSDIKTILEFENKYRQVLACRHGYIIPPHFDAARKIPIDDLYVSPRFFEILPKSKEQSVEIKMSQFLKMTYRSVILGNPGGGKSTFSQKLCYDLSISYSKRIFAERELTPILVVLRDYGADKKKHNCSILQFIEMMINSKYQICPPPGTFEYLFLNGRTMIIFDGLDELLDTGYRQEISNDVESFCTLYPSVPVLVTSREVGYDQAPLDKNKFKVYRLGEFNQEQVKDYVQKWFNTDEDLMVDTKIQMAKAFLEECNIVPDLCANPLMLALICNIYRGENYIPKNRPDVYEKCAMMLFERWDKSRGLHVNLPFEHHINPAMKYLAFWIYSDEKLQGGVTERSLVDKATEYLCPNRFEDFEEAKQAAYAFIEFCRGRAWVFTDTGTTKDGERLYQFTHRTFLEYFAAAHLVRLYPTPEQLGKILFPKIAKQEWDVVAQLAFQLQNKYVEGAGDKLLSSLLRNSINEELPVKFIYLSFALRCLEFLVPSPRITRQIISECIEYCITRGMTYLTRKRLNGIKDNVIRETLGFFENMINPISENNNIVISSFQKIIIEKIHSENIAESSLALEIILFVVPFGSPKDKWGDYIKEILDACSDKVLMLCKRNVSLCVMACLKGIISLKNLVDWHGLRSIYQSIKSYILAIETISLATSLYQNAIMFRSDKQHNLLYLSIELNILGEIGRMYISKPIPRIKGKKSLTLYIHFFRRNEDENLEFTEIYKQDELFGLFILFATSLESSEKYNKDYFKKFIIEMKEIREPLTVVFINFLMSRFERFELTRIQDSLDQCKFNDIQRKIVLQWAKKEVDFII